MIFEKIKSLTLANKLFLLFFLGLVVFYPTLKAGFMWDDHEMIRTNGHISKWSPSEFKYIFTNDVFDGKGDKYFRPVQSIVNKIDYLAWGLNPVGFHITNLFLHIANAILLFFLLKKLFGDEGKSFIVASLFVVHPIIVEQLLIIAGRAELLSLFFLLISFIAFFSFSKKGLLISLISYGFSILSKESGLILPFFLILTFLFRKPQFDDWKKITPYIIIALIYLWYRNRIFPSSPIVENIFVFMKECVRTVPIVLGEYLRILLVPFDLHSHRRAIFDSSHMLTGLLLLGGYFFTAWRSKSKIILFSLGWFLIGFIPKLPLLVFNWLMIDHWAYVSLVGFCCLIGHALWSFGGKNHRYKWVSSSLYVFVLIFWSGLAWANINNRNTEKKLYSWAMKFPSSPIVRYNAGMIYYMEGSLDQAEALFKESLAFKNDILTQNGLALVYWKQGKIEAALSLLDAAIDADPSFLNSYMNKAHILRGKRGLEYTAFVLSRNPNRESAWVLQASIMVDDKLYESALHSYEKALEINPNNVQTLADLGSMYAFLGNQNLARAYWEKALKLSPSDPVVQNNMKWLKSKEK